MEFRQETGAGAMSVPNIVTCLSPWGQTGAIPLWLALFRAPINPYVWKAALSWSRVARPWRRAAGRAADAIDLRACFSAVDCSSNARSWSWNRSTTSRRVKGLGHIRSARAHARPGRSSGIHSENTRCATGVRRRGPLTSPSAKSPRHSSGEPACAIRGTGRTPLIRFVQHAGSVEPRTPTRQRWLQAPPPLRGLRP